MRRYSMSGIISMSPGYINNGFYSEDEFCSQHEVTEHMHIYFCLVAMSVKCMLCAIVS